MNKYEFARQSTHVCLSLSIYTYTVHTNLHLIIHREVHVSHACMQAGMHGWMDGRTDGCMDGWMDGRTDGRTVGWMCMHVVAQAGVYACMHLCMR